jgi:hypothetical protein
MLLFLLVGACLLWMHHAIRRLETREFPALAAPHDLPSNDILGPVLPPRGARPAMRASADPETESPGPGSGRRPAPQDR